MNQDLMASKPWRQMVILAGVVGMIMMTALLLWLSATVAALPPDDFERKVDKMDERIHELEKWRVKVESR